MSSAGNSILEDWERALYKRPINETVDRWAERVLVLPRSVTAIPGPLSLDWCPYLRQPLRDVTDEAVEQITLCWSTQVGKTLCELITVLYATMELKRPAMLVMPTEPAAMGINVERVQPIILESPQLAAMLDPGRKKEMTRGAVRLGGIWLHFVGARSPTELASRAKGFICLDETDKYEEWTGKEADPIELATERARTFLDRVVLKASTPTTERKYIWPELLASTNERYNVPCPHCGIYQALEMGSPTEGRHGIKWPEDVRDPDRIVDGRLAWYECIACHGRIEDQHKDAMLRRGIWAPLGSRVSNQGRVLDRAPSRRKTGYHLWAAYSPWLTFSEIAAKFLSCYRNGRPVPAKLMNFRNSWQALPWQETKLELRQDRIRQCELPYHQGVLPEGARNLIVTVDVQAEGGHTYLYYVLRAWGNLGESWLIRCGRLETWELLAEFFRGTYERKEGGALRPQFALIDSGFRTDEVYQFCLKTGAWALKGSGRLTAQQKQSVISTAGEDVELLNVATDYYKEKLHRLIRERDKWHLPMDCPEEYFDHMVTEQKVQEICKRTGQVRFIWKCVPEGAPNHLFDAECYQIAAAELLQLETQHVEASAEEEGSPMRTVRQDVF